MIMHRRRDLLHVQLLLECFWERHKARFSRESRGSVRRFGLGRRGAAGRWEGGQRVGGCAVQARRGAVLRRWTRRWMRRWGRGAALEAGDLVLELLLAVGEAQAVGGGGEPEALDGAGAVAVQGAEGGGAAGLDGADGVGALEVQGVGGGAEGGGGEGGGGEGGGGEEQGVVVV